MFFVFFVPELLIFVRFFVVVVEIKLWTVDGRRSRRRSTGVMRKQWYYYRRRSICEFFAI